MKKKLLIFTILILSITLFATPMLAQDIKVFIDENQKYFQPEPVIKDGATLVPMRAFFEALGCDVAWDANTRTAVGTREGIEVRLPIGSKAGYVNGEPRSLAVEAQLLNSSTFIPLRFVSEALGDVVFWDGATRTIRISSVTSPNGPKQQMEVHFIDVGQGDAILIQTSSQNVLIDGGDRGDTVVNYLKSKNINSLDLVIGTHPHADHIGGLINVFKDLSVKEVIDPAIPHTTKTYEDYLTIIDQKNIKFTEGRTGMSRDIGSGVTLEILHPNSPSSSHLNDASVVTKITFGDVSFFLTGDAEQASEKEMLNQSIGQLSSTVLKVGHHGSRTSTTDAFLNAVKPKYAVIMVGDNNRYGHPHEETLKKLSDANVVIYRTDIHGTIVFITDGQNIEVNAGQPYQYIHQVKPEPEPEPIGTQGNYVGSIKSDRYHNPSCRHAESILPENKIWFNSVDEAKANGYTPCGVCNPPG